MACRIFYFCRTYCHCETESSACMQPCKPSPGLMGKFLTRFQCKHHPSRASGHPVRWMSNRSVSSLRFLSEDNPPLNSQGGLANQFCRYLQSSCNALQALWHLWPDHHRSPRSSQRWRQAAPHHLHDWWLSQLMDCWKGDRRVGLVPHPSGVHTCYRCNGIR